MNLDLSCRDLPENVSLSPILTRCRCTYPHSYIFVPHVHDQVIFSFTMHHNIIIQLFTTCIMLHSGGIKYHDSQGAWYANYLIKTTWLQLEQALLYTCTIIYELPGVCSGVKSTCMRGSSTVLPSSPNWCSVSSTGMCSLFMLLSYFGTVI